ncbi:MAG: HAD-IC family P-type ATPase [Bacilli bacterium]|nr:HAD-IC family P-type ATPase [Bacilli bacterium]
MDPEKRTSLDIAIAEAEVFDVVASAGLNPDQIKARQAKGLVNKVPRHVSKTYLRIIIDNVFNFLNVILFLVAGAMAWANLSPSHYFFLLILAANILIGLIQDIHARKLTDKLKIIVDPKATVIRNGEEQQIPVNEIVLSDVIILKQGDQVPADAVVLEGECKIDESLLTGEAEHVKKHALDNLYSGSYVVSGSCRASVSSVGLSNYAEKIQKKASRFHRSPSEIQRVTWQVMLFCGILALVFALINFLTYLIEGLASGIPLSSLFDGSREQTSLFVESVTGSVVAMLPAGMFLLTSLTLAVGVIQLAKRRILVQELYCIEALARVDTVCFDKTGTLTDGTMSVEDIALFNGHPQYELEYAVATILHFTQDANMTALALKKRFGDNSSEIAAATMPFDSEKKYSAVSLASGITYAIGAYDFLPVNHDRFVEEKIQEFAGKGYRCLALACSEKAAKTSDLPQKMTVCGLLAISDHLKEDAKDNIAWFQENDVRVYIISGDDPLTVSRIAERAGVAGCDRYVSLAGKTEEELPALLDQYRVFGRVLPEQKALLVAELQKRGHKVAMTGDGVNDILALKTADCSIAMASGADAAKNVAHLVALDSDFSKLPDVVAEGRRVINNLHRTCSLFLSKTAFALILSFIFMVVSWAAKIPGTNTPFNYPYSTSNLLVWELFAIGLPAFFLALQPSKERLKGSFLTTLLVRAAPAGVAQVVAALLPIALSTIWPSLISDIPNDSFVAFQIGKALSVMTFSFVSLMILLRVCLPFDKFRATVFGGAFALGVATVLADFFLRGRILGITWDHYAENFYLVIIGSAALSTLVYFLLDKAAQTVLTKIQHKEETHENRP